MKKQEFIIREFDDQFIPQWRDLDGTVCNSREAAEALLSEFRKGGGYSAYGTREF